MNRASYWLPTTFVCCFAALTLCAMRYAAVASPVAVAEIKVEGDKREAPINKTEPLPANNNGGKTDGKSTGGSDLVGGKSGGVPPGPIDDGGGATPPTPPMPKQWTEGSNLLIYIATPTTEYRSTVTEALRTIRSHPKSDLVDGDAYVMVKKGRLISLKDWEKAPDEDAAYRQIDFTEPFQELTKRLEEIRNVRGPARPCPAYVVWVSKNPTPPEKGTKLYRLPETTLFWLGPSFKDQCEFTAVDDIIDRNGQLFLTDQPQQLGGKLSKAILR